MTIPDAASAIQEAAVHATSRATVLIAGSTLWRTVGVNPFGAIGQAAIAIEESAIEAMGNEP